jgi:hypothetical protein
MDGLGDGNVINKHPITRPQRRMAGKIVDHYEE